MKKIRAKSLSLRPFVLRDPPPIVPVSCVYDPYTPEITLTFNRLLVDGFTDPAQYKIRHHDKIIFPSTRSEVELGVVKFSTEEFDDEVGDDIISLLTSDSDLVNEYGTKPAAFDNFPMTTLAK